jgi:predicted amidohydrolase YtcJ
MRSILLFALVLLLQSMTACFAQKADIILQNGKIFTSDSNRLYVEALAIKGNKILAVGSTASMKKFASKKTKTIDLKGKTVVPGFNDAHDHLGWLIPIGQSYFTEFSVPGLSKEAVIDSLMRLVKRASPGQWIFGTIGLTVFNDPSVRRNLLDSISPNNPLVLQIMWGHGIIANSMALKRVNISDTAPDPLSGWYEREPGSNRLTGVLYEGSEFPIWHALTVAEPSQTVKALRAHAADELSLGITTVQNMSATLDGKNARRIFRAANLPVRTRIIAMPSTTEKGRSLSEWNTGQSSVTALTCFSGIKYVIDGTTLEQTALKSKPYPNRPGWFGRLNYPVDTIRQILKEALTTDRQLMLHIVGDSTTSIVLNLMKQTGTDEQWKKKRVRIEHGNSLLTEDAINKVSEMGIVIVHTPQYGMLSPLQKWLARGIAVAIGPDAVINPFLSIMTVTTQQKDPKQNLSREQAVMAYTKGGAFAEFREKQKGMLAKGMFADLAVLSQDIFTIPAQKMMATSSLLTMVDGKIVYDKLNK